MSDSKKTKATAEAKELLGCDRERCRARIVEQIGGMGFPVKVVSCRHCGRTRTIDTHKSQIAAAPSPANTEPEIVTNTEAAAE